MIELKDLRKICFENGCNLKVVQYNGKSILKVQNNECVIVSKDWIEALSVDDNAFEILLSIAECICHNPDLDVGNYIIDVINCAIKFALAFSLKISEEKKENTLLKYGYTEEDFELLGWFAELDGDVTILQLIKIYGLPLKLVMPRYFGDFYFVAEKNDVKRHMIDGTQYRNGKPYRAKSYSYNEICRRYIEIEEKPERARDFNNSIKERIKQKDTFAEVEVNNDKLLPHQKAGFLLASRYDKFAFFYDTGTGKTVMTLSIIKQKEELEDARFLIFAPKAIIKTAWLEDAAQFFPDLRIYPLSNNICIEDLKKIYEQWEKHTKIPKKYRITKKLWNEALMTIDYSSNDWEAIMNHQENAKKQIKRNMLQVAEHYIVNIEKFRYAPKAIMENYDVNGLVVDESAILKNPRSLSVKTVFDYEEYFDYIYLLSGKPAPNNSTEYYAQMKLVDPETFNMSFNNFKKEYFAGSGSKIIPASAKAEEEVANMVAVRSLIVSKDDCLDLPEMLQEICTFQLPTKIMDQYNSLYKRCIFALRDKEEKNKGVFYSSVSKLAIFTKLREIASGFLLDEYGKCEDLHDLKIKELIKIVKVHPDEQIIIWCQFEHEIVLLEDVLSKYGEVVTAYGKTKDIDENIRLFKYGYAKYILAHPKSIKYGVTFTDCHLAVYYSMSYSAEDYYQSRDRIYRIGQKNICTYYFIQAENTIDEIMYNAVEEKMSYAEIFSLIVKQASKHGVNYQDFKDLDNLPAGDEQISTKKVKAEYHFELIEDFQFTYEYNKRLFSGRLYNTLLKDADVLKPEEILFEIGFDIYCNEMEEKRIEAKKDFAVTYIDVKKVVEWVLNEFTNLNIKKIRRVKDYLQEQIQKQYEYDVANGAEELKNLDEFSLKRKKKKNSNSVTQKQFHIGKLGVAKRKNMTLIDIRNDMKEIFFDTGKYKLTHDCICGDNSIAHCHPDLGLIFLDKGEYENPTPETIFDLLHEIGHLEANVDGMSRQEEEYTATKWAQDRIRTYDFKISKARQREFDDYIASYSSRRNKFYKKKHSTHMDWEE